MHFFYGIKVDHIYTLGRFDETRKTWEFVEIKTNREVSFQTTGLDKEGSSNRQLERRKILFLMKGNDVKTRKKFFSKKNLSTFNEI